MWYFSSRSLSPAVSVEPHEVSKTAAGATGSRPSWRRLACRNSTKPGPPGASTMKNRDDEKKP